VNAQVPTNVSVAAPEQFSATTEQDSDPVVEYRWDFGDGTRSSGAEVRHTFTHSGDFTVHLTAEGVDGESFEKSFHVAASGKLDTTFDPNRIHRLE
jgi:PKD repeat protein